MTANSSATCRNLHDDVSMMASNRIFRGAHHDASCRMGYIIWAGDCTTILVSLPAALCPLPWFAEESEPVTESLR
jgi:hypothetical protein